MKKFLSVLLACLFVFTFAGCGNDDTQSQGNNENSSVNVSKETSKTEGQNGDEGRIALSSSYKVPGKNIVVDVPDYQEMEKGYTELFILHGERYVAVTANKAEDATSLADAHEKSFEKFKENIQNYSYVNSINIKNDSTETINGVEVYKYEGTLNCGHDTIYDAYVIGYSFIMDNTPCTITGSVINQSQPQEQIDEIKDIVEAMIQSLRSER